MYPIILVQDKRQGAFIRVHWGYYTLL